MAWQWQGHADVSMLWQLCSHGMAMAWQWRVHVVRKWHGNHRATAWQVNAQFLMTYDASGVLLIVPSFLMKYETCGALIMVRSFVGRKYVKFGAFIPHHQNWEQDAEQDIYNMFIKTKKSTRSAT